MTLTDKLPDPYKTATTYEALMLFYPDEFILISKGIKEFETQRNWCLDRAMDFIKNTRYEVSKSVALKREEYTEVDEAYDGCMWGLQY